MAIFGGMFLANVASRIEGMTRSYPVEILLSDSTALYQIATVQVKNRAQPRWSPDPPQEKPKKDTSHRP